MPDAPVPNEKSVLTLEEGKLYQLARTTGLFAHFDPAIDVKAVMEEEINEGFPRVDDDGNDTRILILFSNRKGNTVVVKLMDHERLDSVFDITTFMNGFMAAVGVNTIPGDDANKINTALATTLNVALGAILGTDDDRTPNRRYQELSKATVRSIVSIVLDDPLDAVIVVKEQLTEKTKDEPERYVCLLTGIWKLKTRPERMEGYKPLETNVSA